MSDDKLDRFIDDAAKEYNRPSGRVPREEMWARIERERAHPRETPVAPAAPVTPLRRRTQWIAVTAAIAAALAIGVLVGRFWERAPMPPTAENRPNQSGSGQGGLEKQEAPDAVVPGVSPDGRVVAANDPGSRRTPEPRDAGSDARDSRSDISYEVATMNHLAQMEALLTTFRASDRDGQVDAQLATWARDMLSSTRLLLDSPAAGDAKNRRLLEDLELVLVQIVNLAPNAGATDRGSIERTLENGQVMTRLRTAVPAGGLPTGT